MMWTPTIHKPYQIPLGLCGRVNNCPRKQLGAYNTITLLFSNNGGFSRPRNDKGNSFLRSGLKRAVDTPGLSVDLMHIKDKKNNSR